ncbi:MAG: hypothetical protein U0269_31260 [Polyangiales bacterium]
MSKHNVTHEKSPKHAINAEAHSPDAPPTDSLESARTKVRPAASALDSEHVRTYNMDPPYAASVIHNAWPVIEPRIEAMSKLPGFDAALVRLVPFAANALLLVDSRIPRKSPPSAAQLQLAINARRALVTAAQPLADRAMIDAAILERASSGTSFLDVGNGLLMMASEITSKWSQIVNKTIITSAEIETAQRLGREMLSAATARPESDQAIAELEDERARIATLLFDGWNEVRAALGWLRRREGDANELAPSLYARSSGRPKSDSVPPIPSPAQ